MSGDYIVTVCDKCLRASCWHYEFPCAEYRTASTVERRASDLRKLGAEHADHFSREKLLKVCGAVKECR